MATLNRFNKFLPRDYSMKFYVPEIYTPNFEAWDSILSGQQQKYNAAMAATQKYPKHLEWRADLAGEYKQKTEQSVQDITNAYINEGVQSGNRKIRDFAFDLNRQWNPGGLAYELEQEYNDYQGAVKQITDYYEKNKAENSANRTFSLYELNKTAHTPFKYNKTTGIYSRTGLVPNLIPYVDIADEAFKVAKEIKESGTTDIIKLDKAWFEKIQKEGVTPETIQKVTEALLQQPKYSQQLQVEKWLIDQNTSPEQRAAMVTQAQQNITETSDKAVSKIEALSKSKKADDKKALQSALQELGYYTGKVDGIVGPETNKAIDKYKEDVKAKRDEKLSNVNYDNLVDQQIKQSYTQPLVNAFTYEKVKKDLIFNKEWETNMRISAQRKNTLDMITAIQSLQNPETSNYLPSPGLGKPMDNLNRLRTQSQEVYSQSKDSFDKVAQFSGITDIIGYRAPNKIHEVTNARMLSKNYDEFRKRMADLGYNEQGVVDNAWNFYNSPAASDLYNSYTSMQSAKQMVDSIDKTKESMITDYIKTPEGRKDMDKLKKRYNFTGNDSEFLKTLQSGKFSFDVRGEQGELITNVNEGESIMDKLVANTNNYYSKNPTKLPQSLRGYAVNATKGEGAILENTIFDDISSGYTLGYSSDGQAGIVFKKIGTNSKVDLSEVKLDKGKLRFDVNASGITYYLTGKDSNDKAVSAVVNAPREHFSRLNRMAIDMKKEALDGNDESLDAIANELYALTTQGPRYENAIEDALVLNDRNTTRLVNVIDPQRSGKNGIQTFANNANIKGTPVGETKVVGNNIYQKFKVYNPNAGTSAYMMTIQTEEGLYLPVKNKNGGYYYETSQESESPIWDALMISQIPVEINQQKIKLTNISEDEARILTSGAQNILDNG